MFTRAGTVERFHQWMVHQTSLLWVIVSDEADKHRVIKKLQQNTAIRMVSEVCCLEGEERQDSPQESYHTAGPEGRPTVLGSHKLCVAFL